ncbi:MAG: hypothetical protein R2693_10170 [Nocardioidaceae bacterium]
MSSEGSQDVGTSADDYDGAYYDCGGLRSVPMVAMWSIPGRPTSGATSSLGSPTGSRRWPSPRASWTSAAPGVFVQALATKGVDAEGVDISAHAVESAHDDVKGRLRCREAPPSHTRRNTT